MIASVYNGYHINLKISIISYSQTSYYMKEMNGCMAVNRHVIRVLKAVNVK